MQIKYVIIVWWQKYLFCISDISKSSEKEKFAAARQYSINLITQRIYERLHRLLFFTHFCKGETVACDFS